MKLKHGYIQNTESIPSEYTGEGWIYFSEDDKAIYLDSGSGPVKFSGTEVDLSDYYTIEEVNNKIPSLEGYATENFVAEQLENLGPIEGDSATDKDITVIGVNVGNLSNGTVIPEGTSLTKFLEMMLCKTIGVSVKNPEVSLVGASLGNTYEVGTVVPLTLGYSYTDGEFTGDSGYNYSVKAECKPGNVTYYKNDSKLDSNADRLVVALGNTNYKVSINHEASTTIPVNNMGEPVDISISVGSASSEKSITGAYKYFMGYSSKTKYNQFTSEDVRNLNVKSDYIKGKTIITDDILTSDGTSIVIACPKDYSLTSIQNGLGASILDNFECGEVVVDTGSIETIYKVYVYPITNGAKVEFKNVIVE